MPDWSYQTLIRPLLFRMAPKTARDLALGCMGALSNLPLGPAVIDFMGHMRPDARLAHTVGGIRFQTRVGLGCCVDPRLVASRAFSRFGIGFLEVGPFQLGPVRGGIIERDVTTETLFFHAPRESLALDEVIPHFNAVPKVPVLVRLETGENREQFESDAKSIIDRIGLLATGFILQVDNPSNCMEIIQHIAQRARSKRQCLILVVVGINSSRTDTDILAALTARGVIDGVFVDGRALDAAGRWHVGKPSFSGLDLAVRTWRKSLPPEAAIVSVGGLHEPLQALQLVEAGSDLVSIDSGLIFSGPGLVKRSNELLLFHQPPATPVEQRPERLSWYWTCLMAVGLVVGGLMAMIIATTRVVMPYDEMMSGLTRQELLSINERLLRFMAHDRVTLAGTMLAVGILYLALSLYGLRRGMHWAQKAIVVSAFSGFCSFFLFLGFGYFDPFHAFVTAILFQLLIMAVHCDLPRYWNPIEPERTNDRAWYLSQWGQLIFILHGAVLIVVGCVIAMVGISSVFVREDLEFMQTSAEHLFGAHPQLVPLIAHDRATFGGMLLAIGVCMMLSALWGFRRGHGWLWWALITAGTTAYVSTILIHWQVGYTSPHHLFPAYAGLAMLALGGALSYSHLCGATPHQPSK
jgi:dihydroorotate dehydrogenase